jgi:hypothetical protein
VVPIGLWVRLCLSTVYPNDFWWHVRTGLLTLETGALPTTDLFSYTQSGQPWVNQAWLMQIALAWLYVTGDLPAVIFAHALLITAGYTVVLAVCAPRYGLRRSVLATVLGIGVGLLNFTVRPQAFSFLGFGLLVALIEAHRHGRPHLLWWAAPLFALWVNAHGAFIFGLVALGGYVLGGLWDGLAARLRDGAWRTSPRALLLLAGQGLAAVAALALNPQGPAGIAAYVLGFFQSQTTVDLNIEFGPLTLRELDGQMFALATLLLITARLRGGVRLTTGQTLGLVALAGLTLISRRSAAWYGLWLIPILAATLQGWLGSAQPANPGSPLVNRVMLGLLVLLALIAMPFWRPGLPALLARSPLLSADTPVAATAFLCETVPAGSRGFAPLAFAGYQVYACPRLPVFVDTRVELYPTDLWRDYLALHNARYDWQTVADRHAMDYLFLQPAKEANLVAAVAASPAWREVYRDDQAIIYRRAAP